MGNLEISSFRVVNFRNIKDSGWIPLENVTAFVGRNESGKTALLRALHKFNPAVSEPYNPQREFPRDRFTRDFKDNGGEWPVCHVEFIPSEEFQGKLVDMFGGDRIIEKIICTRYYDGSLNIDYLPAIVYEAVSPETISNALSIFEKGIRRLSSDEPENKDELEAVKKSLFNFSEQYIEHIKSINDLRSEEGVALLQKMITEINQQSTLLSADLVETLIDSLQPLLDHAKMPSPLERAEELVIESLPVFIYFENYGILDSAIYLPRFIEDLKQNSEDSRLRTINAMFKHVTLTAEEILTLGSEQASRAKHNNQPVTPEMIAADKMQKELRAVKLNSASLDITERFEKWWQQRRHKIKYHADGDYFRIWVSDDRRPGVEIELEERSAGFQWFFSFYLVFLVESDEGHKEAVLLLDEPGRSLHPTAQQELIAFFEELSKNNKIIYTTHSPFLIDGQNLHRAHPVTEDPTGHSNISIGEWPSDRETIFPLWAATGYSMVAELFARGKNVLVEGLSDYLYIQALSMMLSALGKEKLPKDVYIAPCGGTKNMGYMASLFLSHRVAPVILLDGDEAGRIRRDSLLKKLYTGHENKILMLDDIFSIEECEIEDIVGKETIFGALSEYLGTEINIESGGKKEEKLNSQIQSAVIEIGRELPVTWKIDIARIVVRSWANDDPSKISSDILDRGEQLISNINNKFSSES
ncbi:MAG: AAA family ATPase [Proteobacteria bacterium]|nr:AAA family ATPase [Pseudomonadota bacterium]MBU4385342.1 AAA family ATPase [Pseudomonadota bacterium]MCG2764528.1 AAA family ATPase [Desulfarculaceae bacterium]